MSATTHHGYYNPTNMNEPSSDKVFPRHQGIREEFRVLVALVALTSQMLHDSQRPPTRRTVPRMIDPYGRRRYPDLADEKDSTRGALHGLAILLVRNGEVVACTASRPSNPTPPDPEPEAALIPSPDQPPAGAPVLGPSDPIVEFTVIANTRYGDKHFKRHKADNVLSLGHGQSYWPMLQQNKFIFLET